jgi:hypothetical protein
MKMLVNILKKLNTFHVELVDRVNLESIGQVAPVFGGEDPVAAHRTTEEKRANFVGVLTKEKVEKSSLLFNTIHLVFFLNFSKSH